jgi:hypothetical protein
VLQQETVIILPLEANPTQLKDKKKESDAQLTF